MKKLSSVKSSVITSLVLLSGLMFANAAADVSGGIKSLSGLIDTVTTTVVKSTATLFLSLALLAFFYGIIEYILARRNGDAAGLKKGNEFIGWSLVALFVMFSVYGIIKFSQDTLFKGADMTTIKIPDINFGGSSGRPVTPDPFGTTRPPVDSGSPVDPVPGYGCMPGDPECDSNTSDTGGTGGTGSEGADCATDADCNGETMCVAYKCVIGTGD